MPRMTNLGDLIDPAIDQDKLAIIDLGGETSPREITYRQLGTMIKAVARALRSRGLARGDRVGILSANRSEYLAAYLGAMQAGFVAVPVNYRFPRELTDFVLAGSGAKLVFCDAERLAACPAHLPAVVFGGAAIAHERENLVAFETFLDPGEFESIVPEGDEAAMFLYTSGSTGRPKGVVLSHRSHLWVVQARLRGQALARHRYLIAAPLYHMNALGLGKLSIAAGATMVLLPQFTSASYIDAISRYRCTWLTAVPPMIAMVLRETQLLAEADLSSVECLRMGSAPVTPSLMEGIHRTLPQAVVVNAFGSTEGSPVMFGPHPQGLPLPANSVGCAHDGVHLRLGGVAEGEAQGPLEILSPGLMTGYHNRPDLKSPFDAGGYFISSDVFRRDAQGFYYFVGRADDMFVCGGENIYPGEVEKLLESHPDIVQAVVVPVVDDIKGHKPVAFCVPREGAVLTEAEVKRFTIEHAPAFQHPRFVWFESRLPLAATNKIDRAALRTLAEARVLRSSSGG